MKKHEYNTSPQVYARIAGALLIISFMAGGFGELYVPTTLVSTNDAAATANNIQASESLFRLGFASYLVEAVCDIALMLLLYILLKPIHKNLALMAVLFRILSTATFAFSKLFYFSAPLILGNATYLESFSSEQLNALSLMFIEFYGYGSGIFMVFYGISSIVFGYLIYKSGYLPKVLGALLALGGVGFVIRNFILVLTPAYTTDLLLLPMILAILLLGFWLVVKGVNITQWKEKAYI